MPVTPESFRKSCAQFATGVTVVTVRTPDGTPHGLTANSFTSVSISPPLILVCIDYGCALVQYFRPGSFFGVNILAQHQQFLSVAFAVKPEGRFEGVDWHAGESGAPILSGTLACLECRTFQITEAGDHAIILGEVLRSEANSGDPLVYFDSNYRMLR